MSITAQTVRTCAHILLVLTLGSLGASQAQTITTKPQLNQIKPVQGVAVPQAVPGVIAPDGVVELTIIVTGKGRVNGPGTDCLAGPDDSRICKRMLPKNRSVIMEAVADDGLAFSGWAGGCKGASLRCILSMDKNTTIAATFSPPQPVVKTTLEIEIAAPGGGRVHPVPFVNLPFNCERKLSGQMSGVCTAELAVGTQIDLAATPESEISFTRWESPVSGCNGPSCSFTLQSPTKIRAVFTPPNRTVTIIYRQSEKFSKTSAKKGGGSRPEYNYFVSSKPNGVTCSSGGWQKVAEDNYSELKVRDHTCVTQAPKGSNVTIDVRDAASVGADGKPYRPIEDKEWGGDCTGKGVKGVCTLTLDSNKAAKVCTWQGSPYSICTSN